MGGEDRRELRKEEVGVVAWRCNLEKIELQFQFYFFFQAEDGIRDLVRSRGLGDVYKRQS